MIDGLPMEIKRWLYDVEHTALRLAAVAGEKGAHPRDLTWRENRVTNALLRLSGG